MAILIKSNRLELEIEAGSHVYFREHAGRGMDDPCVCINWEDLPEAEFAEGLEGVLNSILENSAKVLLTEA